MDHQPHVKYEIPFTINALIFYRDPFSIPQTEITWNLLQSFQFDAYAKNPIPARPRDMFCKKFKLKYFFDPNCAGGCGLVRFTSWMILFRGYCAHWATRYRCDPFWANTDVLWVLNALEWREGGFIERYKNNKGDTWSPLSYSPLKQGTFWDIT